MAIKAEYIWLDGATPTRQLRSKTKILESAEKIPEWGYDGSSTEQADGSASDCVLRPVFDCPDPIRGGDDILVMCEVYGANGEPHATNARALLRIVADKHRDQECWFGLEQEYTMIKDGWPAGFPTQGFSEPQGPFYCGVGTKNITGREIVEEHMEACLQAGLKLSGINAEVMPGQWEFQIGPAGPEEVGDHLWLARWLLHRIAEDYGIEISIDAKPIKGDWNGAGCHTNFSTKAMRADGGIEVIKAACEKLGEQVQKHLDVYGAGIEERLTGDHETMKFSDFKYGVSDRGASIRIPLQTDKDGKGYLEDRRPNANIDPYEVARVMIDTTCG